MHPRACEYREHRTCALAVFFASLLACRGPGTTLDPPGTHRPRTRSPTAATVDAARIPTERVVIRTVDGWSLVGDFSPGSSTTAVLLVHQLSSNRHEWGPLLARLGAAPSPTSTLAIDLRGHGESTTGPEGPTHWPSFGNDRDRWAGLEHDIEAGVNYLRQRLPAAEVIIVGSSIGSTAAIRYAARDWRVGRIVALSPGLDYRGLRILESAMEWLNTGRPLLALAAQGDTPSAEAVRELSRLDAGRNLVTAVIYENTAAHGVAMGAPGVHPEMWERIDQWLRAPRPVPATAADAMALGSTVPTPPGMPPFLANDRLRLTPSHPASR